MEISGLGFRQEILASGQLPDAQEVSSRLIQKLDQDGDGMLSTAEVGERASHFADVDTDQDGLIGQEELIQQIESKMAEFGGFKPGEKPNIQKLKSMMGKMQQQFLLQGGPQGTGGASGQENDIFSMLDALETSEDDKERLKTLINDNPFDVFI